jgi:hypothetical protein
MSIVLAPWLRKKYRKNGLARNIEQTAPVYTTQLSPEELQNKLSLTPTPSKKKKRVYAKEQPQKFKFF